ncbi:porin [Flavobacterium aquidurense]|uniref:OprO/OprP family phosphate-selective porin n=1 Tax=Flavobacterium aquidurense TaxID=362413 RepID=UPI002865C39F|nr:porin [Flavobacterium aquidurense]MDR7371358.1 phosphate-selective porin OprO/OprP [Flavobacterium aquidurense]
MIVKFINPQYLRVCLLVVLVILPFHSFCQETEKKTVPDGTEGDVLQASETTKAEKLPWNMFDTSFTTIKLGAGFLYEYAGYVADATTKRQMDSIGSELKYDFDVRDFRILIGGQLKTKRTITWKAGFMYDGDAKSWYVRESGVMIATPEIWGSIFIGRTKEGFSLSKVMNGYSGESLERHMAIDAIPILGDGIKWLGYLPKQKIVWNMGIFADWLSKDQGFSTYSWQFITRAAWLPIHSEEKQTTLHIGGNFRIGQPEDNKIRLKSKPESNTAPIFIDTGTFSANQGTFVGWEIYYSKGPMLFGTEYSWQMFNSSEKNDPVFHGGEVMASYIFTGASRPYTTTSGIYTFIPVEKSVFHGGLGEIEAVLRYSTNELNGGTIQGGRFWRITPTVNWYLSKNFRFEFAYGYGILDRFSLKGATQFFQSRIQILL